MALSLSESLSSNTYIYIYISKSSQGGYVGVCVGNACFPKRLLKLRKPGPKQHTHKGLSIRGFDFEVKFQIEPPNFPLKFHPKR